MGINKIQLLLEDVRIKERALYNPHVSTIYPFAQGESLEYQISDLKKNLTNGTYVQ